MTNPSYSRSELLVAGYAVEKYPGGSQRWRAETPDGETLPGLMLTEADAWAACGKHMAGETR